MRIHEIIREKRLEQKMTQEQLAEKLGVSAPAVNKWEKAASYPDITILPTLARLLGVDLNTLLSFKEELTKEEVDQFVGELYHIIPEKGFQAVYEMGMEKLAEYPTCDYLWYMTALTLQGAVMMFVPEEYESYTEKFEKIYEKLTDSKDVEIAEISKQMLISKYMSNKDYEAAEALLNSIPKKHVNVNQLRANLYKEQGKLKEAGELYEGKLLTAAQDMEMAMMGLVDIAVEEGRIEDAEYILKKAQMLVDVAEQWEYGKYSNEWDIAYLTKDIPRCMKTFEGMMREVEKMWELPKSPLYRYSKRKSEDSSFWEQMKKSLVQWVREDAEAGFLRESPEFMEILKKYE